MRDIEDFASDVYCEIFRLCGQVSATYESVHEWVAKKYDGPFREHDEYYAAREFIRNGAVT